jgi:hypothetical protein
MSNLTKVGVAGSSSSGNFRASNWALDGSPAGSLTGSPDLGKYFQVTVTGDSGFAFNRDSLTCGFGRSGTGPRASQWRSSIDNYAAPISSYSSLGGSGLFSQSDGVLTFISDSTATTVTSNEPAGTYDPPAGPRQPSSPFRSRPAKPPRPPSPPAACEPIRRPDASAAPRPDAEVWRRHVGRSQRGRRWHAVRRSNRRRRRRTAG